jgi:uncharacterized protein (DUF433 family)
MKVEELIEVDPEKLGGAPVFFGTRVPVQNLIDCLVGGESLDEFLEQFPTVTREQAQAAIDLLGRKLVEDYEIAA